MIVKLQRPLLTTRPPMWLAYGKTRHPKWFLAERDLPGPVLTAMGDDPKGYFEATVAKGKLVVGERVDDQPW